VRLSSKDYARRRDGIRSLINLSLSDSHLFFRSITYSDFHFLLPTISLPLSLQTPPLSIIFFLFSSFNRLNRRVPFLISVAMERGFQVLIERPRAFILSVVRVWLA
jgi:hypothetical protein